MHKVYMYSAGVLVFYYGWWHVTTVLSIASEIPFCCHLQNNLHLENGNS